MSAEESGNRGENYGPKCETGAPLEREGVTEREREKEASVRCQHLRVCLLSVFVTRVSVTKAPNRETVVVTLLMKYQ